MTTKTKKRTGVQKSAHHFSITGEAFTEHARNMLLSELPAKAYRMLANGLLGGPPGAAAQTAFEVLDGKKKLIGTSDSADGLEVVDDVDSEGYLKTLHYIYAGRILIDRKWYRPYAHVVGFNERDATYASQKLGLTPSKLDHRFERWAMLRVEFYGLGRGKAVRMGKRTRVQSDAVFDMRNPNEEIDVILFEECGEPPFWWPEPANADEAYAQFLAAGRRLDRIDPMPGVSDGDDDGEGGLTSDDGSNRVSRFIDHRAEREAKEEAEAEAEFQEEERLREEREDNRRTAEWMGRYRGWGAKVREQADGDYIEIALPKGYVPTMEEDVPSMMLLNGKIRVPRAPFVCWCLWRTNLSFMKPDWEWVAPSGLKMPLDDSYHTDWMLGADIHLRHSYDTELKAVAYETMSLIQREYGGYKHVVLVNGPDYEGLVGKYDMPGAIMVLPDLRNTPENNMAVANARAIITEVGGELAHVATLARENSIPVMRVKNAMKLFPVGTRLTLNPARGRIYSNTSRSGREVEVIDGED